MNAQEEDGSLSEDDSIVDACDNYYLSTSESESESEGQEGTSTSPCDENDNDKDKMMDVDDAELDGIPSVTPTSNGPFQPQDNNGNRDSVS